MPIPSTLVDRVSNALLSVYNRESPYKITNGLLAVVLGGGAVVLAGLSFPLVNRADDRDQSGLDAREFMTFAVDLSQHLSSNVQNNVDPSENPQLFSRGDTFTINGSIYPQGSIQRGIAEPNPNAHVIGTYRMRGTFTGNTAEFNQGIAGNPEAPQIIAFATESFSLPNDGTTILTDGIWPNARKTATRVVLGGTGRFRGVIGEAVEESIGENLDGFCNLRVKFKLRTALTGHEGKSSSQ